VIGQSVKCEVKCEASGITQYFANHPINKSHLLLESSVIGQCVKCEVKGEASGITQYFANHPINKSHLLRYSPDVAVGAHALSAASATQAEEAEQAY